ncbi:hypothetical protein B296_00054131 [Ensete ventricosum]|uniref:DUF834 domain-containing protein n=1 Tax=Ensete ventricosum TaxID=4639 RepID=A0A426Y534_ENSVE|nr:hypothetical protein B296_00054131 [Ensete ventricosum]
MAEKEDDGNARSNCGIATGSSEMRKEGTVAIGDYVAAGGSIGNHDNVAGRGRRGQQLGDVGEGDLGSRGGKGNGGKQGQWLLQRVMARMGATVTASGGSGRGGRGRQQRGEKDSRMGAAAAEEGATAVDAGEEGGGWATLERKGGWVAAIDREARKKKGATIRQARVERSRGGSGKEWSRVEIRQQRLLRLRELKAVGEEEGPARGPQWQRDDSGVARGQQQHQVEKP